MTVVERVQKGIKDIAHIFGRRERTPADSRKDQRQFPPTDTLIDTELGEQIFDCIDRLPAGSMIFAVPLSDGTGTCNYVKDGNEQGRMIHRYTVAAQEQNKPLAEFTLIAPPDEYTRTVIAHYGPQTDPSEPCSAFTEGLHIPTEASTRFTIDLSVRNGTHFVRVTASRSGMSDDEQPDMDQPMTLPRESHVPLIRHILGHVDALTQLATN